MTQTMATDTHEGMLRLSPHDLYELLNALKTPYTSRSKPIHHRPSFFPLEAAIQLESGRWMMVTIVDVTPAILSAKIALFKGPVTIRLSTINGITFGQQAEDILAEVEAPDPESEDARRQRQLGEELTFGKILDDGPRPATIDDPWRPDPAA